MKTVAEGNNPHVVNLIGCVTIREPLCLITEFVKYGDLLTYLQTIRKMVHALLCACNTVTCLLYHQLRSSISTEIIAIVCSCSKDDILLSGLVFLRV